MPDVRLIDANEAKKALTGWDDNPTDEEIEHTIDELPTVDAVPVVHARWVQEDEDAWRCTRCGALWIFIDGGPEENGARFCPVCGALMDAKEG